MNAKSLKATLGWMTKDTLEAMKADLLQAMDSGIEDQKEYDAIEAMYNLVKQALAS